MVPFEEIMSLPQFDDETEYSKRLHKIAYDTITEYLLGDAYLDFDTFFTHHIIGHHLTNQYNNEKLSNDQLKRYRMYLCRSSFEKFTDRIPINPPEEMYDCMFDRFFDIILNYKFTAELNIIKILIDYTNDLFPDKE